MEKTEQLRRLIKQARPTVSVHTSLDLGKALASFGKALPKGLKYGAVAGALGASSGAALGEQAEIISGNSGLFSGGSLGAKDSALAGTLAGTALEIMSNPELRKSKEGKVAAALAAALSLAIAWRKPTKILSDKNIEKSSSWQDVAMKSLQHAGQMGGQGAVLGGTIGGIYGAGRAAFDPNESIMDGLQQGLARGAIRGGLGGAFVGAGKGLASHALDAKLLPQFVNQQKINERFADMAKIQAGMGGITGGLNTPHPMQQTWENREFEVPGMEAIPGMRKQSNWRNLVSNTT